MPAEYDECPSCGITWKGDEIPDGLMKHNPEKYDTREKAEEAARSYGWTPENKSKFGINVIGVQYAHDNREHWDGVSEWRCTKCNTRVGRFTGKILEQHESEPRPVNVSYS